VSAHENPCALNVKKTFDKQKDIGSCPYQRLKNDKAAMLEATDKFHQIYQRAQQCQNKQSS